MTQRDAALKKRQALINKGVELESKGIKIHNECIFINVTGSAKRGLIAFPIFQLW